MSQLPPPLRIGFIGAGRLGTALAWCLNHHGLEVVAVASRTAASAERLAAGVTNCSVGSAQAVVDACNLVFITTPDGDIASTCSALQWRRGMAAVHCSGATEVRALAKASADGAWIGGMHPLQSVADPGVAATTLPGCTLTLEAEPPLHESLVGLAARLGCPVNHLPAGHRAAYHAAAGYASQFVHVLLREASALWQTWGATEAQALQALLPLLRGSADSMAHAGIAQGMPGPVSRGDVGSVHEHLQALGGIDSDMLALYRTLCLRSVPLALERGGLGDTQAAQLMKMLQRTPPIRGGAGNERVPSESISGFSTQDRRPGTAPPHCDAYAEPGAESRRLP